MIEWYEYRPCDTITLKGAGRDGERGTQDFFPLPSTTVAGALRTAVFLHNRVKINQPDSWPENVAAAAGRPGEPAPFNLAGPLLRKDGDLLVPAPHHWFREKQTGDLVKARQVSSDLLRSGDGGPLPWIERRDCESLAGKWIFYRDLQKKAGTDITVFSKEDLAACDENRVGLMLDSENRSAEKGFLYNLKHLRFFPGITMVWGVDRKMPLPDAGLMNLGGERRFGSFRKISPPFKRSGAAGSTLHLALTMIAADADTAKNLFAAARIQYVGGWDLFRGFHKPARPFYSQGAVFTSPVHGRTVQLEKEEK